jgi:hypothetical protein
VLEEYKDSAIKNCKSQGCDCEIIILSGNALVSKDILLAGGSLSTPINNPQSIRLAETKSAQPEKQATPIASSSCNFKAQIKYQDGTVGCVEDLPIAKQIPKGESKKIIDIIQSAQGYAIAQSVNPSCLAIGVQAWQNLGGGIAGEGSTHAKEEQKNNAINNCKSQGCDCEIILLSGNALVSKDTLLVGGARSPINESIAQKPISIDPKIRLAEANRLKQEEALQAATAQEKLKLELAQKQKEQQDLAKQQQLEREQKLAEQKRLQVEMAAKTQLEKDQKIAEEKKIQLEQAQKQQAEKEQKLAEEKRAQQDLAKQQQLEREQKLAEQKRLQAEMAAKAQTEKEQKLAEEKRKQEEITSKIQAEKDQKLAEAKRVKDELAKVAQQEKDQKELALKQKKEADQQAQTQLAAQAPKASYVGKRLALVIGNSKYSQRPLDNPVNDANDVSKALKSTGFEVIDVRDATLSQMRTAVRLFGDKLLNNDVGLVYYSGHGIEVKGRNYFIPVNADIKRSDEIADQSLDVGLVLDKMETAQKAVNILIVDACRDDPFGRSFRSGSRGLATMDAPQGTIIAFATSPGKVAADGDGRNSPYTKNLVVAMQEPNVPIEQVFKQVRRAVQKETKGQQTPWENTSLSGDFYFSVKK